MATRRALCVGVERFADPGLKALEGPVGDARTVALTLIRRFGFAPDEVTVLSNEEATKARFLAGVAALIAGARPGDLRVLYVATHGSTVPDLDDDEADGRDEVLVLYDHDWEGAVLRDDALAEALAKCDRGVELVTLWDLCHSGTLEDLRSQHYAARAMKGAEGLAAHIEIVGARSLEGPKKQPRRGAAAATREAASKKKKKRPAVTAAATPRAVDDSLPAISLSACADDESAASARFGGMKAGAFTWALADVLRRHPGAALSYEALAEKTRETLKNWGFKQTPQLHLPPRFRGRAAFRGPQARAQTAGPHATGHATAPGPGAAPLAAIDQRIVTHEARREWHLAVAALWERVNLLAQPAEKVRTLEHLASVYVAVLNDPSGARAAAEAVLALDPQHAQARAFLKR